ncbi:DarT ssDNA thymidine ADP-ribosyltransferase family protein [Bacillus velezensis]|uniref:DarT ssDNA thymidine ADP-ribosyltransferase family protein n=1 Tax=Bacillus TaxID=1386 RepID=UPI001EFB9038|nr:MULTISPECIES: DarT ssDNA thymidine ADP-ribosyltransferase family protein [Bacillus]MCE4147375.1 DUF4433 domain-containing protein [Bacillus velezensis]MDV9183969.1 DarT ssDNA thymidine ADP-ribosyltransferase family protein [Bacillus sp. 31]MEC3613167.1 DarT ssDNA thymidine ADP-ribosyltransferase family protein [Bacillus velezensis]MEC3677772.1 DarT ssDNA thymidine ADP-ribosyltransferase family protein [Bacillus velezensis]ULN61984.1 DUF4433 domain-containing protein [Bacillus velezensis]
MNQGTKNKYEFKQVIDELTTGKLKTGLPPLKMTRFPKYVYHFTDLLNAKNILTEGYIYCRNQALEKGIMKVDNASKTVIENTWKDRKNYVRFYFRPKTPTQYRNEGIRSHSQINPDLKAHCPVPVFFLFDSLSMLAMDNSGFTYGNLASDSTTIYNDAESFRKMPFEFVYHEGYYDPINESYIKYHRHAELIIPNKCDLRFLKRIVCRSQAEKETFINLLDESTKRNFRDIIIVDPKNWFFYSAWTFVESVNLTKEKVTFTFNVNKDEPTFNAKLIMKDLTSNGIYETWCDKMYQCPDVGQSITYSKPYNHYSIAFYLDEHLVYKGTFNSMDSGPF